LYDPLISQCEKKMDKWVKCTTTSGKDNARFVNLDHVAEMYRISDDRETRVVFASGGEILVQERPQDLFMGRAVLKEGHEQSG
jgi:hypothetical protein